jgi:hypothetical protein
MKGTHDSPQEPHEAIDFIGVFLDRANCQNILKRLKCRPTVMSIHTRFAAGKRSANPVSVSLRECLILRSVGQQLMRLVW